MSTIRSANLTAPRKEQILIRFEMGESKTVDLDGYVACLSRIFVEEMGKPAIYTIFYLSKVFL